MEQTLTAKLYILPAESDMSLLIKTMKAYSLACSYVAKYVSDHQMPLNQFKVQKETYDTCRSVFTLPSQMAVSVTRTVIASYKTIQTMQAEHPDRFKKSKRNARIIPKFTTPQVSLVWNRDYSLVKDKVTGEMLFSVNTLNGRIKVSFYSNAMDWAFAPGSKFGTAKLVYKHGKFFLHVPVTKVVPDSPVPSAVKNVVGIDRGIRFLASAYNSEGKTFLYSGRDVKRRRAHYKEVRAQLQKRRTPSSRRRLKAIGSRENRWMDDVDHCLSKALVESQADSTLFVLEDLTGIRGATERIKTKDRYISVSWAYYDLETKLMYKAARKGDAVIKVDPRYTSQTCPKCGHVEKANRDHFKHIFKCCNCGYTSNDDRIAAMNLHRMGIEYLTQAQSSDKD